MDYQYLYSQLLQPLARLSKKHNRAVAISAAVAMTTYIFVDNYFRPPRRLRHFPYQGLLGFWASFIRGESYWDKALSFFLPTINAPDNEGVYMVKKGLNQWSCMY
jgi:hypothetical protein